MALPRDWDLNEFIHSLKFERDIRQDLDDSRRREFRTGWVKAVEGRSLTRETLRKLTWHNLGSRAGEYFGSASRTEIDAVLDELGSRHRQASQQ